MHDSCFSVEKVNKIRTGENVAGDGVSTVASVEDGLNTVGVLGSRNQAGNINSARVRGLFLGRFAFLAGEHRQLGRRRHTCRDQSPLVHFKHTTAKTLNLHY